jgi:hypothetical protein
MSFADKSKKDSIDEEPNFSLADLKKMDPIIKKINIIMNFVEKDEIN